MPFSAFDLFCGIEPAFVTSQHRFYTLAIDNADAWFRLFIDGNAYLFTEMVIDSFQRAIISPFIEIVGDMIPVRTVMWQHPPLASGFGHIAQGVDHFANSDGPFASRPLLLGNVRLNTVPFLVIHIRRIG